MTQNAPVHQLLRDVLCPSPERTAVAALVHRCHSMALAYLRVKERSGSLSTAHSGIAVEDMAFDAIADLFRRTPQGSYIELQTYFRRADPSGTLTENEIQTVLRRLVFSAVNHYLFRSYREQDPALAKIIRNIKLALKRHPAMFLTEQCGLQVLSPVDADPDSPPLHLQEPELLAPLFHQRVSVRSSIQEMIGVLSDLLRDGDAHHGALPLIEAALLVRDVYHHEIPVATDPGTPHALLERDLRSIISTVMDLIGRSAAATYLSTGKLTGHQTNAHLRAVRDILTEEFIGSDGLFTSYICHLRKHLGALTDDEYRQGHRVILEYLARSAKREARRRLAVEW